MRSHSNLAQGVFLPARVNFALSPRHLHGEQRNRDPVRPLGEARPVQRVGGEGGGEEEEVRQGEGEEEAGDRAAREATVEEHLERVFC